MKFILLIFCLMCSNILIAQKKDSVLLLYKENIELKKQLTDIEKTIIRVETEYKALEKIQSNWLTGIGIISALVVVIAGFSILKGYNVAKTAGEKASADIKVEFDAMKTEIKNSQEKLLNLNNEAEKLGESIKAEFDERIVDMNLSQEKLLNLNEEAELMLQKARGIINSLAATSETPNQSPDNT